MEDSIFAKIVAGEVPAHKIYENDTTLAFLDIHPKNEGHTLVIPKVNPTVFVWDLDPNTYAEVMKTAQKVALRLRSELSWTHVHEAIVGTDVPYAHVHLTPFNTTDDLHKPRDMSAEPNHAALAALAKKLYFED